MLTVIIATLAIAILVNATFLARAAIARRATPTVETI